MPSKGLHLQLGLEIHELIFSTIVCVTKFPESKQRMIFAANSFVGSALARAWAKSGDSLTIIDHDAEKLGQLAKELRAKGSPQVEIVVMSFDDVQKLWREVDLLVADKARVDTLVTAFEYTDPAFEFNPTPKGLQAIAYHQFLAVSTIMLAAKAHIMGKGGGALVAVVNLERSGQESGFFAATRAATDRFLSELRKQVRGQGLTVSTVFFRPLAKTPALSLGEQLQNAGEMAEAVVARLGQKPENIYYPSATRWTELAERWRHLVQ